MSTETVNPHTGEVIDPEQVAREFVSVARAHDEAVAEARRLGAVREMLSSVLREVLPPDGVVDVGDAVVVKSPPAKAPARRVIRSACEPYAEQLIGLGLGRMGYLAPTMAEVRTLRAEIIAAGIPLETIAPIPVAGPATIEIVKKDRSA